MSGFNRDRLDELPSEYATVIADFEEFKRDTGKGDASVDTYLNRVTEFFEWLVDNANQPSVSEIDNAHTARFNRWAKATHARSTYRHRIITLNHMFEVLDSLDHNIWTKPVESVPDSQEVRDSHKHGRELDVSDVSQFILSVRNPLWHAFFLTLIKTLCRNQEATNILLSEVHINDPDIYQLYDDLDITLHPAVSHSPDSIYIPSDRAGNKRKSDTRIPIDPELKSALIQWLTVRPTTKQSISDPQTLFVSLGDNWGQPVAPSTVSMKFGALAPESWRPEEDPFTPHNFRHWTNRQLRGNIPDHCLSYLRGDAPDILDHYDDLLAEYQEDVREPYLRHIPSLYF